MCIRSAQSIISGKQHPLLSRVLNYQRIDRDPDGPLVSTCASAAPRGQLQIQGSARSREISASSLSLVFLALSDGGPESSKRVQTDKTQAKEENNA